MIRMLILDGQQAEAQLLQKEARRQAAVLTDDRWEIKWMQEWKAEEDADFMDIAYLEISSEQSLSAAEQVRRAWNNVYMVLIVSGNLSPLKYLRPTIMAASLLLRPFQKGQAEESIREAISFLPSEQTGGEDVFIIADRDGKLRLSCRDILYFEARAKKIYAALENEEYGFYDSMEHLMERLPSFFFRCHRGYVVNLRRLKRYQSAAGVCILSTDAQIPVSRSYRQSMKERFSEWKQE